MADRRTKGLMEPASLKYLLTHPWTIGVDCSRPLALLLLLVVGIFFLRRGTIAPRAATLRSIAFGLLVLSFAGVRLTTSLPDDRLTVVAALDMSESISKSGTRWGEKLVNRIASGLSPGDELAVLTFAGDVNVVRHPSQPSDIELTEPLVTRATDIKNAIDSAVAMLPASGNRRVLLVSDGNETRGDARRLLAALRHSEVRIDAAVPPHEPEPDVRLERLIVPSLVPHDSPVAVRVVARNTGKPRPAVLTLSLDGKTIESSALSVEAGVNTFDITSRLHGRGSRRLSAKLDVRDDSRTANNQREVGITVRGRTKILLVTSRDRSLLGTALGRKGMEVSVRGPDDVPPPQSLAAYHGIVLEDLTAADLSPDWLAAVESYVRQTGGGLIFVGGSETFGDKDLRDTSLKQLLPVTLEPHRPRRGSRDPLALFILIDRSNSMGYNSRVGTIRDGEKLRYAKEAALAVIDQLRDQDLVGVIAFDSQPREISPLLPLSESRELLRKQVPRLVENGGTDFFDALDSARKQLAASRVSRRHVVLLTDGDTNRSAMEEYTRLVGEIADANISVTTIRIGDNTVNLKLLRFISERSGGNFHYVENAQALPDLMLRDTTRALGPRTRASELFYPKAGERTQVLAGIEEQDVPPLAGYAYSRPKEGSEIPLQVARMDRQDPILALWRYGLGRVVAFTASPLLDAEQWMGWAAYGKFWSQAVEWASRNQTETDYIVDVTRQGEAVEMTVRTFSATSDDAVLIARLHVGEEVNLDVGLALHRPREYSARIRNLPGGTYPLTIIKRSADGAVNQQTLRVTVPEEDTRSWAEHEADGANIALLTALTEGSDGILNPSISDIVDREPGSRLAEYPLEYLLLPLAMFLFLGDIAVRRLGLRA